LEASTRAVDPERIKKVRKASYQGGSLEDNPGELKWIRNSYAHSLASASVSAVAKHRGNRRWPEDFDARAFCLRTSTSRKSAIPPEGKQLERLGRKRIIHRAPIRYFLRNHVAAEFLSLLAHSFFADQVQKGKSPLRGSEEKNSSPTLPYDRGLMDFIQREFPLLPFDGEGC